MSNQEHPADSDVGQRLLANEAATALLLEGEGYRDLTIELLPERGEFVASAVKRVGVTDYKAQAMGRTRADAARALVKTIQRP